MSNVDNVDVAPEPKDGSERIWFCKIGGPVLGLPGGADGPMRGAVQRAYRELTGVEDAFCFSGWDGELTEPERAVVEDRLPQADNRGPEQCAECERTGRNCLAHSKPGKPGVSIYDSERDANGTRHGGHLPDRSWAEYADHLYRRLGETSAKLREVHQQLGLPPHETVAEGVEALQRAYAAQATRLANTETALVEYRAERERMDAELREAEQTIAKLRERAGRADDWTAAHEARARAAEAARGREWSWAGVKAVAMYIETGRTP